ncbi:MAG TPA: hypothetical protein PLA50_10000 [Bacteroidia bacterium]|nr:hypothetical protein [Bacteroidia bacterium]
MPREVREILAYYEEISGTLADDFWSELTKEILAARQHPEHFHFDPSGRRRANLKRFPYHFLFRVYPAFIRITIVRHNKRHPRFGSRRE